MAESSTPVSDAASLAELLARLFPPRASAGCLRCGDARSSLVDVTSAGWHARHTEKLCRACSDQWEDIEHARFAKDFLRLEADRRHLHHCTVHSTVAKWLNMMQEEDQLTQQRIKAFRAYVEGDNDG